MPERTSIRRAMYQDDDLAYYAQPVAGRNYVELSPRSALYIPTEERFWNRDDNGKPRRGWNAPNALYRLIGVDGLLYVGIGVQPEGRWQDHKHTKPWWKDVLVKTVDWLEDREQAEIAEYYAIKHEAPRYNAQHLWPVGWQAKRGNAIHKICQQWGGQATRESNNVPQAA